MKVEKCPRCGKVPQVETLKRVKDEKPIHTIIHDERAVMGMFKFIAIMKFNRWARREAKRIAKEGATK